MSGLCRIRCSIALLACCVIALFPESLPAEDVAGEGDGRAVKEEPTVAGFCPGSGDCCVPNGTPGCNNFACCEDVCFIDPFCCNTEWDATCVDFAAQLGCCGGGGACPGTGDCCVANGTPGCDNTSCCKTVCAIDNFCCDNNWDLTCANRADTECGDLCGGGGGGPVNDGCGDALPIGDGTTPFDTTGATTDGPDHGVNACGPFGDGSVHDDVWYTYTASCTGLLTVSTCEEVGGSATFDSRIAAYDQCGVPPACPGNNLLGCNDDDLVNPCGTGSGGFHSTLEVPVVAGNCYTIRLGGFDENTGGPGVLFIACAGPTDCQPACDKMNVECLNPGPQYDNRRPVARLLRQVGPGQLVPHCTGWMIGAPDCMMTNQHCVAGIDVTTLKAEFNYECDLCNGGECRTTLVYDVAGLIHADVGLDYALLDIAGNPAAAFGTLPVSCAEPGIGSSIYEIHHAEGEKKGYDEGVLLSVDVPGGCIPGTDIEVGVSVIASQGASGSPIFGMASHAVEAICHCGPPCSAGWGVPMSAILPDALPHILGHGCTVQMQPACECLDDITPPQIDHDTTSPCSGHIDPGIESTDGTVVNRGFDGFDICFTEEVRAIGGGPLTPANFTVSQTGAAPPPTVTAVNTSDDICFEVALSRIISLQEWTTVQAHVEDTCGAAIIDQGDQGPGVDEPDRVDIAYLPGDVDQSSATGPFDVLAFRQLVNGIIEPSSLGCSDAACDYIDVNRNLQCGAQDPFDLLALRQMANGVSPATRVWNGVALNHARP